jgi:hypothetical protein
MEGFIMKKNWTVFPVILMILAGLAFATVFSCGSGGKEKIEDPDTEEVSGGWTWALSDDATPNPQKGDKQSIFAPGGASRITNAREETLEDGTKANRPYVYPKGEAKDDDDNPIDAEVFNFKGNTKVSRDNRGQDECARFPMVGWEAVPDEETLALLQTVYGYSFWVRLKGAATKKWSFSTVVVTSDIEAVAPEEGWCWKHWFGNTAGGSANSPGENLTPKLEPNVWYKINVVLDKSSPSFNLDQDGYIYQYNNERKKTFNQDKAVKIQWQISLQHQEGANVSARDGDPYDIIKGSYDFDLDFYGFALNQAVE